MAQMTMIARVVDGLPLVGTMQEDEQVFHKRVRLLSVLNSGNSLSLPHRVVEVFSSIRIRPKCYSENWDHIPLHGVPLKLGRTYSSELTASAREPWPQNSQYTYTRISFPLQLFNRK